MELNQQSKFEGWAIVELMGHQREIGYVTTEYYGAACLFRVDVPDLPEREFILTRPQWNDGDRLNIGTKVRRAAVAGRSRLLGVGSLYAVNPCTEEAARVAIEEGVARPLIVLELPKGEKLIELPAGPEERVCEECGNTPEEGHEDYCSFAAVDDEDEG
jgi:hypothetical protein